MSAVPAGSSRAGTIGVIGRPNVGKSTLVNALVGARVSITSRKPQTTRTRVRGVLTQHRDDGLRQFVFVDTPGLQRRHRGLLVQRMNQAVVRALAEVDVVLLVIEARGWTADDARLLELLPRPPAGAGRVVLAINKIDRLDDRSTLLPIMADSAQRFPFAAIVPISAERGEQLAALLDELGALLSLGEPLFDADTLTDRSARFMAAEFVREQAFRLLGDELPYGLAVAIERWDESARPLHIAAAIWVEREAHKGIVIGTGGSKLRDIGQRARAEIETLLGQPVFLELHVRVRAGWAGRAATLGELGYD